MRNRLVAATALMLAVGTAWLAFGPSKATAMQGSDDQTMEQFLTSVTKDVDAYWTKQFESAGLAEPRVTYQWIPAGWGGRGGGAAPRPTPPRPTRSTSREEFATNIYNGALDQALPGSSQGYGKAVGDFAVAYIVAHEYGHQIQDELGLFDQGHSTKSLELQADCYAATWAKSADEAQKLDEGDVQEAMDAALAVGDFDPSNPGHHGTPEEREQAWQTRLRVGRPGGAATRSSSRATRPPRALLSSSRRSSRRSPGYDPYGEPESYGGEPEYGPGMETYPGY